jgi:hypothetical protein
MQVSSGLVSRGHSSGDIGAGSERNINHQKQGADSGRPASFFVLISISLLNLQQSWYSMNKLDPN